MEIQFEDLVASIPDAFHKAWTSSTQDPQNYKTGIEIHYVSARIMRMSKRRQKIAVKRGRGVVKVLRGAYPIIVDAPHEVPTEINITFTYDTYKEAI